MKKLFSALSLVFALAACSTFGLQKAQSPEDNLRYAQGVLTGVYKTIDNAVVTKAIEAPKARTFQVQADKADGYLKTADTLLRANGGSVNLSDANTDITLALQLLTALDSQLRAQLPPAQTAALVPLK